MPPKRGGQQRTHHSSGRHDGSVDASRTPTRQLPQCGPLLDLPLGYSELEDTSIQPAPPQPYPPPPLQPMQHRNAVTIARIAELVGAFQRAQQGLPTGVARVQWEDVQSLMVDPACFQAAGPQTVPTHWRQYFATLGAGPNTEKVLAWLLEGYKPPWVHPHSPPQQAHPKYAENLAVVAQQVEQVVGRNRVSQYINRTSPAAIQFPNRKSALENPQFVLAELEQAVNRGVVRECTKADLTVISGLGVVGDVAVKGRLILNAMYLNLFCRYKAFHYESLRDVQVLAQPGDVIMVTDFKSGYHHIPLHPSVYRFFGLEFQGRYFFFTVLPFGLASGCYVFTSVAAELMRPLMDRGLRCLKFIDDIGYFLKEGPVALVGRALVLTVFAYLRFYVSPAKCHLQLSKSAPLLGLICDVENRKFIVPPAKVSDIQALITNFLATGGTKRELAQLAGKLASIAPAVQLAPLFSRRLFQAMGQVPLWDQELESPEVQVATPDLLYFQEYLKHNPGWGWAPRPSVAQFVCAGDASETGYGGHSALLPRDLALPFSRPDQQRMQEGKFSSTEREVKNVCLLVQACIRQDPQKVAGSTIVCLSDNQGAVANVNNMRGSPQEVDAIRDMWVQASLADVLVRVEWRPRESEEIRKADMLSRVKDRSDYALSFTWTQRLFQRWGRPTGDAFAGPWGHAQKAPLFFTATPSHVGCGFDATIRDWGLLGSLVWVFPPVWLLRQAIAKIQQHRCNAILLVPGMGLHHAALIQQLPVKDAVVIPPHPGMFEYGSQYPRDQGKSEFICKVHCFLVRYDAA